MRVTLTTGRYQSEEGADGLSDMGFGCDVGLGSYDVVGEWWQRMVASMGGVDGWRRWWTGVFDTEGTAFIFLSLSPFLHFL